MNKLKYVLLDDRCEPKVGTEFSAGLDLRVFLGSNPRDDMTLIRPKETKVISTGVKVQIPEMWCGIVVPRSSTGKLRIALENTMGIIDSDYRGEILLRLYNFGTEDQVIYNFDRITQLIIVPHYPLSLRERVESLDETVRGEGGFGHTGNS